MFRFEEFAAAQRQAGASPPAIRAALAYHVSTGRLLNLRRGLYCSTVAGTPDPWVIGSKLTPDAVLAWDGALSLHGVTGLGHRISVMARNRVRELVFNEVIYRSSAPPLRYATYPENGVVTVEHAGEQVRVTTLERTLVDCLDRPDLGPGLEALWEGFAPRRLEGERIIEAALLLGSPLTAMRTGLFLHFLPRCRFSEHQLDRLRRLRPTRPVFADRSNLTGDERLLGAWHLRVSGALLDRMRRDRDRLYGSEK